MIEEILKLAIGNGLWAVLFVFLFLYQIKENNKREKKYVFIIEELSKNVGIIKKVYDKIEICHNELQTFKKLTFKRSENEV
ncbi:MAG: bacteriocin [Clostridia bacterium]|nr:bacteriocin [Clostridia bacterium]